MFKSLEFDNFVVQGLRDTSLNREEWQAELPLDLRPKVMAIVEAPNWSELTEDVPVTTASLPASETILRGKSAFFGVVGVAAILCGIVFGFLMESSLIVYRCLAFGIVSIGTAIFLQSRTRGLAAAFGIELTPSDALTLADFVRYQMAFAQTLRAIAIVGSVSLIVVFARLLSVVNQWILGADDSMAAALIRLGTICFMLIGVWRGWNSWRTEGAAFQVARCLRGFLACKLSPFWVSWLYETKSKTTKPPGSGRAQTPATIRKVTMENWPLPAIFLFCVACAANSHWFDGMVDRRSAARAHGGKSAWVNDVAIWMSDHPTSTLWLVAALASFSIAFFSYRLSMVMNPKFSGRIAIAVFFLSILLFAVFEISNLRFQM